jgi:hypothetical protein
MPKKLLLLLTIILTFTACSTPPALEDAVSNVFQVGDEWAYQTRPGEGLSTFIVTKIDKTTIDGEETTIIHIALNELAIEHPDGGLVTAGPHMPFTETALIRSALQPFNVIDPIPQENLDAYQTWRDQYEKGNASFFNTTIARALDNLQATIQSQ